jgi:hypothetical protein
MDEILLFGFLRIAQWCLAIQLPLRGTYILMCWRAWTLSNRDRSTALQWTRQINRDSTYTTTWRTVNDSIIHITFYKIYYCRSNISCWIHQIWLWELGRDTIALHWPWAFYIDAVNIVFRTTARVIIVRNWTQSTGTNLESRGKISS